MFAFRLCVKCILVGQGGQGEQKERWVDVRDEGETLTGQGVRNKNLEN